MRLNDIGLLAIVFLAGLLIGVVGTLGVYNTVASRQAEAERREVEDRAKDLEEERDQLQAKLNDYAAEQNDRQVTGQPGPEAAPLRPTRPKRPAASAPGQDTGASGKREAVSPPREDKTSAKAGPDPAAGFGPPREYGNK